MESERLLAELERRMADNEERLARVRDIIEERAADGRSTVSAYELLREFEAAQYELRLAYDRLRVEAEKTRA